MEEDRELQERLAAFSAQVSAASAQNAGPVEKQITGFLEEMEPRFEAVQLLQLEAALGEKPTKEEELEFLRETKDTRKMHTLIAAVIRYLEAEHERRAAWEKEIDAKIMSCLNPRGAF